MQTRLFKINATEPAAEGLYKMGEAVVNGDWEALRNESYNMLMLGLSMRSGETPLAKRDLQRSVKQVGFLEQQLKRGIIEDTPLKFLEGAPEGTKGYVVESVKKNAEGQPITAERIVTAETFAKACDGILEINAAGEVVYKVCFAAGTLVHTKLGLVPIEKIRTGDLVLSQPEDGGEIAYKPVLNTVIHTDKEVFLLQFHTVEKQELGSVVATGNHPFWVDGQGWLAVEYLEPGQVLELRDGSAAVVHSVGKVHHTQLPHIGWAADDRNDIAVLLDLRDGTIKRADDAETRHVSKIEVGEPFTTDVFNFEVEQFHTYYVQELGVWVHNSNCDKTTVNSVMALEQAAIKTEAIETIKNETCFAAGTLVHTKEGLKPIEDIQVGDWVLSHPESSSWERDPSQEGANTYRQVTKTFVHEDQPILHVTYVQPGGEKVTGPMRVTANHPVMKKGAGWTPAGELKLGDALLIGYFGNVIVTKVKQTGEKTRVFNIEVDEFHTYFIEKLGVWVHNKNEILERDVVGLPELREVTTEQLIYKDSKYENPLSVNSRKNTGNLSEDLAQPFMEASTGIDFRNDIRNGSNNGPDLFGIVEPENGKPGQIVVLDVKGSLHSNYPSVKQVGLDAKDGLINSDRSRVAGH